jgi:hypothetical protein
MKNLLVTLSLLMTLTMSAQSDTTTLTSSNFQWYQNDTKTWVFDYSTTLTDLDTLFAGGDTIVAVYDTVIIDFPHKFGTPFAAYSVINTAAIDTLDGMTGFYRFFQAACDTCEYVPIIASTALTTPAQFLKSFELHMIRLRLVLWTTGDTGTVEGNLVLKPSSLTSD